MQHKPDEFTHFEHDVWLAMHIGQIDEFLRIDTHSFTWTWLCCIVCFGDFTGTEVKDISATSLNEHGSVTFTLKY